MSLDANQLGKDMIAAASAVFNEKWPETRAYAELEFNKLADSLKMVAAGVARGDIKPKAAKALIAMHTNSAKTILLTLEGLGLLLVEAAINAAIQVVREAVNTAAGVVLL